MAGPEIIDVMEFAREGKTLVGEFFIGDLPRLQDFTIPSQERLQYKLFGALSERREARIECTIQGYISLECQYCLGVFRHHLDIHSTLIFVADEHQLPAIEDEDESIDYLVAEKTLDLLALIEDEVILAFPLAPRHEASGCEGRIDQYTADSGKLSSFDVLAKLKQ